MTHRLGLIVGLALGAALLVVLALPFAPFAGTPANVAHAAPPVPAEVHGDRFFRQAIAYVANGKDVVHNVTNFFAELEDVRMNWEDSHHEGYLRLWFANPDKYRFEMRSQRKSRDVTTKLLVGNEMWVISPSGSKAMHKSAEGAAAIKQARQDRERLSDLSKFLTLAGLLGNNVKFVYQGPKRGSGTFAGEWLQVDRTAPDGSVIAFFFAYEKDAQGRIKRATHPGVVTVVGDPSKGEPTEHFILSDWREGQFFRFPGKISAYAKKGPGAPKRFMLAFTRDIRINAKMPPTVFAPPVTK